MPNKWKSLRLTAPIAAALCALGASVGVLAQGASNEASTGVKPSPIQFSSKFGSLSFPEKFPAGTTLSITQWSHFVPRYDKWFDDYAQQWGAANNVKVTVQHISYADLNSTLAAAVAANSGPTLVQMNATPAAFIQGLQPLNDVNDAAKSAYGEGVSPCTHQTYLPVKKEWYAYCVGWVVDPSDYRISLWKDAGYPQGPITYDDLFNGGTKIYQKTGIPVGVGMSPEINSEFYARSLIWSFGGQVQDACGNVTLDSPQVIDAVKYQAKLFHSAETPEVFSWNAASNNQAFVSGRASYIRNSISFYRTAQKSNPKNAADTGFRPGLKGPTGQVHQTAHVWFIYVLPKYVTDQVRILRGEEVHARPHRELQQRYLLQRLYDVPAYPPTVPQLDQKGGWIDHDPWNSNPPDKLSVLRGALAWTAWLGYPGHANPATSEVYNTFLLSTMMAQAARGEKTPEQAVKDTAAQIQQITDKWKRLGYVGCEAASTEQGIGELEVRGVSKHFGDFRALKGIDLATQEGEFLTIVGPSGCGKTTLMRVLAGLETPTAGDVVLNGTVITPLPPRARNIAMVFQNYALYPHMSVGDNIAFPLKARGVAKAERQKLIHWAAGVLGIGPLLHRRPARLSGGEKQKVALARAIVRKPSLFIFDEPLSSLDAQVRAVARAELRQLHDRTGVTTVYVTHDQVEAVGLGDRVAVMQAGELRQIGSPQELYYQPANTFVAGFIGTPPMNLLEHAGTIVGFRPEHVLPRAAVRQFEDDVAAFQVCVTRVEFLGSEWLAYGSVNGAYGNAKVLCKLRQEAMGKVKVGEVQEFVVSRAQLRFFNKETGRRSAPAPI